MEKNIIERFYTAFGNKDYKTMRDCYCETAIFSDPVFGRLNATEVKAMWEMLLKRAPDLQVSFNHVVVDEDRASARWIAHYTFSSTGKKVVNKVSAEFLLQDGQILKHTDTFDFYAWAKQSLGLTGLLLGKTNFLKQKISKQARKSLEIFMQHPKSD